MRGSTTAIVGANGNLQKGYAYDEFGSIEESGNVNFLNEVTFTGSITDISTGLQYMNARFYDADTGRFISQDTYSGNPYDPWTQHLYVYTSNNPVNFVDPTGHVMANLQTFKNQKASLLQQKTVRSNLVNSYYRMIEEYRGKSDAYSQKLYSFALDGYIRNLTKVTEINGNINTVNQKIKFATENYDSADEAAIAWATKYNAKSMKVDREFGGKIYSQTQEFSDGSKILGFNHSKYVKGERHRAIGIKKARIPSNGILEAYIHTHAGKSPGFKEEIFSPDDYNFMQDTKKPLYMICYTGTLQVLTEEYAINTEIFNSRKTGYFYEGRIVSRNI